MFTCRLVVEKGQAVGRLRGPLALDTDWRAEMYRTVTVEIGSNVLLGVHVLLFYLLPPSLRTKESIALRYSYGYMTDKMKKVGRCRRAPCGSASTKKIENLQRLDRTEPSTLVVANTGLKYIRG